VSTTANYKGKGQLQSVSAANVGV